MTSPTSSPAPAGILLLAAGFSRRFGSLKLAASLQDGDSVIARTLKQLRATQAPLRIVTRADLQTLLLASGAQADELVLCEDATLGMGHTLAAGMRDLPPWSGCLVCLADMPFMRPDTLALLLQALHRPWQLRLLAQPQLLLALHRPCQLQLLPHDHQQGLQHNLLITYSQC